MVTGSPTDKPAFLDPQRAAELPYVSGDPAARPKFDEELIAEDPAAPSRGIINRYREIARLHAHGKTNNEIAAILGYTASRMSIILKDPFVQTEIGRWRDALVDEDAIARLREAARDGASRIHAIILDPTAKDTTVLDASKFAIEKTHGKAKQEVSVESGTLGQFMDLLRDMSNRGEVLDVTPGPAPASLNPGEDGSNAEQQVNRWSAWLDTNL